MASTRQLHTHDLHLHHRHVPHQHRLHGRLRCRALPRRSRSHGNLWYLDRLRPSETPPRRTLPSGSWDLGKTGIYVNAIVWPNGYEPNAQTFNWAVVLFAGIMSIACVEYFVHAKRYYEGPVVKVEGRS